MQKRRKQLFLRNDREFPQVFYETKKKIFTSVYYPARIIINDIILQKVSVYVRRTTIEIFV